jgi:hypothetical protein
VTVPPAPGPEGGGRPRGACCRTEEPACRRRRGTGTNSGRQPCSRPASQACEAQRQFNNLKILSPSLFLFKSVRKIQTQASKYQGQISTWYPFARRRAALPGRRQPSSGQRKASARPSGNLYPGSGPPPPNPPPTLIRLAFRFARTSFPGSRKVSARHLPSPHVNIYASSSGLQLPARGSPGTAPGIVSRPSRPGSEPSSGPSFLAAGHV